MDSMRLLPLVDLTNDRRPELVYAVPLGALSALRADLSTKCSAGLAPTQRPRVYIPAHPFDFSKMNAFVYSLR
jgi:hypothetical protein